jgi:hypothetical protein
MDVLLLAFTQHRLWHVDADRAGGGVHLINEADEVRLELERGVLAVANLS